MSDQLREAAGKIERSLRLLFAPGEVFEVRAPKVRRKTISGYFNDPVAATAAIVKLDQARRAPGIYVTLNPVNRSLIARAANRMNDDAETTSADKDVERRNRLLLDIDPKRSAGISSSDAEHEQARQRCRDVYKFLSELGFPEPIVADSGNGYHLVYPIDLRNDEAATTLIRGILGGLDFRFSDDVVKIDTSVYNAGRIVKVWGTRAGKGDSTADRPHRRSRVVSAPDAFGAPVPQQLLERVAALCPPVLASTALGVTGKMFDVQAFLSRNSLVLARTATGDGRAKYVLEACPFNPDHRAPDAAIFQDSSGALGFKCFHDSCAGRGWADVRSMFEPGYRQRGDVDLRSQDENATPIDWQDSAWPRLPEAALYGLAGDFVRVVEPHSEADPAALLIHFLVSFGALVGPGPHYVVESTLHPARLYALIIGPTASGRKGTARARVRHVYRIVDETSLQDIGVSGLASGEGLIAHLADRQTDAGEVIHGERRALVQESEFGRVLAAASRDGSTLSAILRDLYDDGRLQNLTKKNAVRLDGAHVCLVGDITIDELNAKMPGLEITNGLLNRFLIVCARRSKRLPHGGSLTDAHLRPIAKRLCEALGRARLLHEIKMAPSARDVWSQWYESLEEPQGILGAATARAEAQALRLALTYALIDGSASIDVTHLRAAFALWDYCFGSAAHVLGSRLGDPIADRLLAVLRAAYPRGVDGREQHAAFARSLPAGKLEAARESLERRGLARRTRVTTQGRPLELWHAVPKPNKPKEPNKGDVGEDASSIGSDDSDNSDDSESDADGEDESSEALWAHAMEAGLIEPRDPPAEAAITEALP